MSFIETEGRLWIDRLFADADVPGELWADAEAEIRRRAVAADGIVSPLSFLRAFDVWLGETMTGVPDTGPYGAAANV